MEYCRAAASSPLAPPNCSSSMLPKRGSSVPTFTVVHQSLHVVIHLFYFLDVCRSPKSRGRREDENSGRQSPLSTRFSDRGMRERPQVRKSFCVATRRPCVCFCKFL